MSRPSVVSQSHNLTKTQRRHILNLKISKCHQRNKCCRTWTLFSKTTALVDYYYFLLSLKIEISLSHHGHSMLHQSSKNLILKIFFLENHSIEDVCCHNCTLWLKKSVLWTRLPLLWGVFTTPTEIVNSHSELKICTKTLSVILKNGKTKSYQT